MRFKISYRQMVMAGFLFLVTVFIPSYSSADEQENFDAAKQQNTLEAWDTYIREYPNGQHSLVAKEAFDSLLLKQAVNLSSNAQALETILKRCKTSACADKVSSLWDEAAWNVAKELSSSSAYKEYLLRFPRGAHVQEAKTSIEDADWRNCQQSSNTECYELYLNEYPGGKYVQEAKGTLDDLTYQRVKEKDTIEAYEEFLKDRRNNETARKRLNQLRYERAVKTDLLEDWIAYYDNTGWRAANKDIERMQKKARKKIERLLYKRIITAPTLELCEDYLRRYIVGKYKKKVMVKMEPLLFDLAIAKNNVETYLEYLGEYPKGYRSREIKKRLNEIIFTKLDEKENFNTFSRYLGLCPKDKPALKARMEPFMFDWAKRVNSFESYKEYLLWYPKGASSREVRSLMDPFLFEKAKEQDWYSAYEDYIEECPKGTNVQKAKERIEWLKAHKAIVDIDYPEVIEQRRAPYYGESGPYWRWETVFKETSGKMGFKVSGSGYIIDSKGVKWVHQMTNNIPRKEIKVPPGGQGKNSYELTDPGHTLCNGYAMFTWSGEDAGGHPILIYERVKLQHTDCPGSKKKDKSKK